MRKHQRTIILPALFLGKVLFLNFSHCVLAVDLRLWLIINISQLFCYRRPKIYCQKYGSRKYNVAECFLWLLVQRIFVSNLELFPETGNAADYLGIVCVSKKHKQCLPTFSSELDLLIYFCKPPILMAVRKIEQMYSVPA